MLLSSYLEIQRSRGLEVCTIGVNHHDELKKFPCQVCISHPHSRMEITNETLQAELMKHPYIYKLPKIDIAVLGTHEDYFCYQFGRLFSEKVPKIAYPVALEDKFAYIFKNGFYEEMYNDGEYIIMKRTD